MLLGFAGWQRCSKRVMCARCSEAGSVKQGTGLRCIVHHCCDNKSLQTWWLKIAQIYYLTISVSQKSNTRLNSSDIPYWRQWGKILFFTYSGCWLNLTHFQSQDSSPCFPGDINGVFPWFPRGLSLDTVLGPCVSEPVWVGANPLTPGLSLTPLLPKSTDSNQRRFSELKGSCD